MHNAMLKYGPPVTEPICLPALGLSRVSGGRLTRELRERLCCVGGASVPFSATGRVGSVEHKCSLGELGGRVRAVRDVERQEGVEAISERSTRKAEFPSGKIHRYRTRHVMLWGVPVVAVSENARARFAKTTSGNPAVANRAERSEPDPGRDVPGKAAQKPNCAINPAPG